MSFKCQCCGETVTGDSCILIPAITRKVDYMGYRKFTPRGKEPFEKLETQSRGWEIVKELSIAKGHYDKFIIGFKPTLVEAVKMVKYDRPKIKKDKFVKGDHDDQTDEAPEKFAYSEVATTPQTIVEE